MRKDNCTDANYKAENPPLPIRITENGSQGPGHCSVRRDFKKSQHLLIIFQKNALIYTDKVVHSCNPNTQEVEVEGFQVQGQPGLHGNFLSQTNK